MKIAQVPRQRHTSATARAGVHSGPRPSLHRAPRGDGPLADDTSATQSDSHRAAPSASLSRRHLTAGLSRHYRRDPMACSDTAVICCLVPTLERQTEISTPHARDQLYRTASNAGTCHDQAKARRMWVLDHFAPAGRAITDCQPPASRGHASRPPSRDRDNEHNATSGIPIKPYRSGNDPRPTESRVEIWNMVSRAIENAI